MVVATDSEVIAACVEKAGGRAVMTRADHASGSDRIFEALQAVDPERSARDHRQRAGRPAHACAADLARRDRAARDDPAVDIGTLAAEITRAEERTDPNVVKVVGTPVGEAAPARALFHPRHRARGRRPALSPHRPLRLIAATALARFVALPPSPLEQREKLEQLRALEAGMRIDVTIVDSRAARRRHARGLERARADADAPATALAFRMTQPGDSAAAAIPERP